MQRLLAACLLFCAPWLASAAALEELKLLNEQPVSGVSGGNLSGLAWCDGALWAVSDRDDQQLYRLESDASQWQASAETFVAPPAPDAALPWGLRMRNWAAGQVRGGELDFEGACTWRPSACAVACWWCTSSAPRGAARAVAYCLARRVRRLHLSSWAPKSSRGISPVWPSITKNSSPLSVRRTVSVGAA